MGSTAPPESAATSPWASLVLPLKEASDASIVGGKAVNLAAMLQAGLPVPDGFVVTTNAFQADDLSHVERAVRDAYDAMESPPVAVRSSATAEDLADASMAGQYETFLDVRGGDAVWSAVQDCWASLRSDRVTAYLQQHDIDPADVAVAVVVQTLIPAETAGVLFTANPHTGDPTEMLIEASYGLGEMVVSGEVQPDTLHIAAATGAIRQCEIGSKHVQLRLGDERPVPVPESDRRRCCLTSQYLEDLRQLGQRAQGQAGEARDLEWAIADGRAWLLQSRAITTLDAARSRRDAQVRVRSKVEQALREDRGPWVMHNLAETVPRPTPLTWSVLREFMSGSGGYGRLYRDLGFEPSPSVETRGALDLIGGRIYLDLSRGPEMFFADYPFRYDAQQIAVDPDAAMGPPTVPDGSLRDRAATTRKLQAIEATLSEKAEDADRRFVDVQAPAFREAVAKLAEVDLSALDHEALVNRWRELKRVTLDEFAPISLLPSLAAAQAMQRLEGFLADWIWDESAKTRVSSLAVPESPNVTLRMAGDLRKVGSGEMLLDDWLAMYGHRAGSDLELSEPRHAEQPDALQRLARQAAERADPLEAHRANVVRSREAQAEINKRLPVKRVGEFEALLDRVRRYLPLREDAKHELIRGYALLRTTAREIGRRLQIDDEVFLLSEDEMLEGLRVGLVPLALIHQRKRERVAQAGLELPRVIGDAAELFEPKAIEPDGRSISAFTIAPGKAEGRVRLVERADDMVDLQIGDVLVCPSTDPSWTPLFAQAAAVVMERGGTLSHGAVVAREMGKPAVVVEQAMRRLVEGEHIEVDATRGVIVRLNHEAEDDSNTGDVEPALTPADLPPRPGSVERKAAKLRNIFAIAWTAFLLLAFFLPQAWLWHPTLAVIDGVLLPVVRWVGPAGTVGIVAVVLAVYSMAGQRWLTDNTRLRVAKKRAAVLRKRAMKLDKADPRRGELLAGTKGVQMRLLGAAMVPLMLVLGPMVMVFAWMPVRIDPASWNPPPGSDALIYAEVWGDHGDPIRIEVPASLSRSTTTKVQQAVPDIRGALQGLRSRWRTGVSFEEQTPWPLRAAAERSRQEMLASLQAYLDQPIPPQRLAWTLTTPDQPGRYEVTLRTADAEPLTVPVVVGQGYAPPLKTDRGQGPVQLHEPGEEHPIAAVEVVYRQQRVRDADVFFRPFAWAGWNWDSGWLWVYLAVYLAVMFVLKLALRVA